MEGNAASGVQDWYVATGSSNTDQNPTAFGEMTIKQLKEECVKRKLPVGKKKSRLVKRLSDYEDRNEAIDVTQFDEDESHEVHLAPQNTASAMNALLTQSDSHDVKFLVGPDHVEVSAHSVLLAVHSEVQSPTLASVGNGLFVPCWYCPFVSTIPGTGIVGGNV